jgi:hypothetical protein
MKHLSLLLPTFLLVVCTSASASVSEIRQNFFNQTTNLPPRF